MPAPSGILFYGDPHGFWQPLLDEYARQPAKAVVLLGDCQLERPLHQTLEPISTDGCPVFWIHGNHDVRHPHWWSHLTGAPNGLHGRVNDVAGLRLAGLGGTYAGRVWYPVQGDEEPKQRTRRETLRWLKRQRRGHRDIPDNLRVGRDELPLLRRATIYPEDHDTLRRLRADVLVCHEAPTSHPHGFGAIDDLAKTMGVKLIVHGHHHWGYKAASRDGIEVRGLGLHECWRFG